MNNSNLKINMGYSEARLNACHNFQGVRCGIYSFMFDYPISATS